MKAKDNPFRADKVEGVPYYVQDILREDLYVRLRMLHYRAAIVGREGTGKTTLLEQIKKDLEEQKKDIFLITLNKERPYFFWSLLKKIRQRIDRDTIILLDGADVLPFWHWKILCHLTKKAAGLIVTTHSLKLLPELIYCRTNKDVLQLVLEHLLGNESGKAQALSRVLFDTHKGNIREVLRDLYEEYALKEKKDYLPEPTLTQSAVL